MALDDNSSIIKKENPANGPLFTQHSRDFCCFVGVTRVFPNVFRVEDFHNNELRSS
jgi:hypothetical protein